MAHASDESHSVAVQSPVLVRTHEKFRALAPAILSHALLLAIWYLVAAYGGIPAFILPSPSATLQTLFEPGYAWMLNTYVTAAEILVGYVIAVVFGIALALVFYWFRWLSTLIFPVLVTLSMVPKVALGPLFVVWFSYGMGTNIFIAFIISFFPILLTTWRGLREVEPEMLELLQALKASRWQIFVKIQLPNSLPYIFSGMKVGSILAVAGAIVGEFIASENGLGYLMIQVQAVLDTAAMFMAVILLSLLGIALYLAIIALERVFVVQDSRID
ncbi:ABC transporter permease [Nitratireductor aquimarinus]|uniref:ABC transporter permease n=1 Tax=Nitratireductor TaxID=245876 RepID=UPI0019D35788|nr:MULTISPECIES: ABC transporter permease [Nitratireductor]MBN7776294.1 ABC transporter permease [Nitratireductor pacificus]MBN7779161.1 ABC transporter permease [Nitratireductor pacificus]MBN7787968.1 ABC transporter permease [Nitratireductor aquimarinus]MBY6098015.1 ABC transporter permease [Nitratireductor aquimarinus]MCA1262024.1 ABC transporter permease [Nitratireductor aquimarinus]